MLMSLFQLMRGAWSLSRAQEILSLVADVPYPEFKHTFPKQQKRHIVAFLRWQISGSPNGIKKNPGKLVHIELHVDLNYKFSSLPVMQL